MMAEGCTMSKTPRVDEIIDDARRRCGVGEKNGLNTLFCKVVTDELPRMARRMEVELRKANEKIAELQKSHERYEKLRRLTPREFSDLWNENLHPGVSFDVLVDGLK